MSVQRARLTSPTAELIVEVIDGALVFSHWGAPSGAASQDLSRAQIPSVTNSGFDTVQNPGVMREASRGFLGRSALSGHRNGKAWSSLGRKLDPITQDACIFYEDHTVISEQGGKVVFEVAAGEEFASLFPTGKAAIHQNHGLFTVGTTVEAAAFWFITMDRSCQAQLLAEAAGTPKLIDHDSAMYTQQLTGFADAGWFQFQPLFQEICATDPDLFD